VIAGDLNAYPDETPLQRLAAAGYANPLVGHGAAASGNAIAERGPTTFRYRGRSGMLDYVLVKPGGSARVEQAAVWHSNADEPRSLDYNLEHHPPGRAEALYAPGPWRASDHDPVYVDLRFH
jgi:hypothetical protein